MSHPRKYKAGSDESRELEITTQIITFLGDGNDESSAGLIKVAGLLSLDIHCHSPLLTRLH